MYIKYKIECPDKDISEIKIEIANKNGSPLAKIDDSLLKKEL
jgi:hypothetical protein